MSSFRRKIRRSHVWFGTDCSQGAEVVSNHRERVERNARLLNVRFEFESGCMPLAVAGYEAQTPIDDIEQATRGMMRGDAILRHSGVRGHGGRAWLDGRISLRMEVDANDRAREAMDAAYHQSRRGNWLDEFARVTSFRYPDERRRRYRARQREKQINHHALVDGRYGAFWHRNGILAVSKKVGCCQEPCHAVSWQYDECGVRRCCYCWNAYEEDEDDRK